MATATPRPTPTPRPTSTPTPAPTATSTPTPTVTVSLATSIEDCPNDISGTYSGITTSGTDFTTIEATLIQQGCEIAGDLHFGPGYERSGPFTGDISGSNLEFVVNTVSFEDKYIGTVSGSGVLQGQSTFSDSGNSYVSSVWSWTMFRLGEPTLIPTPTLVPAPTPTLVPTPTPTPTPTLTPTPTPYTALTVEDLKERLDFVFETNPATVSNVTVFGETTRVEERSYRNEALAIFTEGYYMLTGTTPEREGWTPHIYSAEAYNTLIDEKYDGSMFMKRQVLGWCCETGPSELELVIRGDQPLSTVIHTLAHEAGHARQRVLNSDQSGAGNDTNIGAVREAQAYAFSVGLLRALESSTGRNVSLFPNWPSVRSYIDDWTVSLREHVDDLTDEHNRGIHLLWLVALSDPELERESYGYGVLSPESLFRIHGDLIAQPAHLLDAYGANLLQDSRDQENRIRGRTLRRLNSTVPFEGFIKYSLESVIVP